MFSFPYENLKSGDDVGEASKDEQYNRYSLPRILAENDRFDVSILTSGITEGMDFTPAGDNRFKNIRNL